MIELLGKQVVVIANGISYTGRFVEMNEEEVHLESESGWVVIPVERVAVIKEKGED